MKITSLAHYRNPSDATPLTLEAMQSDGEEVVAGVLVAGDGHQFAIVNGIPQLLWPLALDHIAVETMAEYDRVAQDIYDRAVDWQFAAFLEDEDRVRETMVDLLRVSPNMRVLEVGCGTGRDSFRLARRLGRDGALHLQDLSPRMVEVCRERMQERKRTQPFECALEYSCSNATNLPYANDYFDAVFHFGGFNQFSDHARAAAELARVCKPGGRVLFGDEAIAPWLVDSEFAGIVIANNGLFKAKAPLRSIPVCAREVSLHWVVANCFYVIAFTKGDGFPALDMDLFHAGGRGGSLRTRYFGVLEGVRPETKALVAAAAARAGLSQHEWLDQIVRTAAMREATE